MKRTFRIILTISICLSICIPANAAVSVSDGSAFITNAEFNAGLNNLSNRMATLENSIDAKIDSLVSSYLTRNGIWNGEKQEISDDSIDEYDFMPAFTLGNVGTKVQIYEQFKDKIVLQTSKTGMVFGTFSYGNHHNGDPNNWYYGVANATTAKPGWIWDCNFVVTLSFYETDTNVTLAFDANGNPTNGITKSTIEIGKSLGMRNFDSSGNLLLLALPLPEWNVVPFTFFSEKGKTIWWRWLDELSTYNWSNLINMNAAEGYHMHLKLDGVYIY